MDIYKCPKRENRNTFGKKNYTIKIPVYFVLFFTNYNGLFYLLERK
jgi:hypothetical protein